MEPAEIGKKLQESLQGIFYWGTRYHAEKIAIIVGVVVLSLLSTVWALSGSDIANELGARVESGTTMGATTVTITNAGRQTWTDVRIVVDRKHLYRIGEFEGGERLNLTMDEFDYAYHIPRSWGREGWEELADEEQPGIHPDRGYEPSVIQIRANEGQYEQEL